MFSVSQYIINNRKPNSHKVPQIVCADGFTISVQASEAHYCHPRIDDATYYTEVECGYPSSNPEFIQEYAENSESLTGTVYPYTPVELVNKLIDLHGGLKK